ncbi:hypothetical protein K491DRAFT_179252 [Lophiostoma macrostomum CBS 122681]|uniref:Uncharacterized protein n=1 Tax=Lophiostoma macrostomum CBS 122681 TaxID=1314788 RepID=A0A6A6TQX0_9PLEO|nr:hypothetical protein K491DRAFT_179252 [Lophiostoma macrostomum CBS 122681]
MRDIQKGWRTAKRQIINYVQTAVGLMKQEQAWQAKHLAEVTTEEWLTSLAPFSALAAMEAYGAEEEELSHVWGDPAGSALPAPTPLKRKRGAEEDGDEQPVPAKRRNAGVTFSSDIWVSDGIYDVDDSNRAPARLRKRRNGLKEATSRKKGSFGRRKPDYVPGAWRSPAGYEKADTRGMTEQLVEVKQLSVQEMPEPIRLSLARGKGPAHLVRQWEESTTLHPPHRT